MRRPLAIIALSLFCLPGVSTAAGEVLLNQPESVVFDAPRNRYLVSNFADGNIVQIDADLNQAYFDTTLTRIAGLFIEDDTLYVASNLDPWVGLVGYDLTADTLSLFIPIPESTLLNDLTTDDAGNMYVTDYWDTKVFQVDLGAQTYEIFALDGLLDPNGIVYDAPHDRVIVTSHFAGYPLQGISLADGSVSNVVTTSIPSQDGLGRDAVGNFYTSSWYFNAVFRYDPDFASAPVLVSDGHSGPADIYVDALNHILCVPNFHTNTVEFIPLEPTGVPAGEGAASFTLADNYPEPFNATTTIAYELANTTHVRLDVLDGRGRRLETLVDGLRPAGAHRIAWSSRDLPSGVYFYRLVAEGRAATRKMVMVK